MSDIMRKVILAQYPDYDFERHSFKFGEIVKTNTGATIFVIQSAIEYVEAFVLKSGFGLKKNTKVNVNYTDLPYFKKDEYTSINFSINKGLKWEVGQIVMDKRTGSKLLLTEENDNGFHAIVIESENKYYLECGIYVRNPLEGYIVQ